MATRKPGAGGPTKDQRIANLISGTANRNGLTKAEQREAMELVSNTENHDVIRLAFYNLPPRATGPGGLGKTIERALAKLSDKRANAVRAELLGAAE